MLTIINSNMANAIRSRTVQKGIDPRGFALVAFGGAGPLHGAEVAAMLGIPEVIVPPFPGITSAMGLLTTDLKYDVIRTQFQVSGAVDLGRLNSGLPRDGGELLAQQFAADKIAAGDVSFERIGDLRYVGQGYELKIPLPRPARSPSRVWQGVWAAFHRAHAAEYGHSFEASPIEIVNVRVSGIGQMPKITKLKPPAGGSLEEAHGAHEPLRLPRRRRAEELRHPGLPARPACRSASAFAGPAIILQKDSTTVMTPHAQRRRRPVGQHPHHAWRRK